MSLKDDLIKLGNVDKDLRPHIRPLLDALLSKTAGDPYQDHLEKMWDQALADVKKDGRNRYKVRFSGTTYDVSVNRRLMTHSVEFGDGTLVQVQRSGNGMVNVTNNTGDTEKSHIASEVVKKIRYYEEAMAKAKSF